LFAKKTESKFRREHHMKMSRTYSLVIPLQTYSIMQRSKKMCGVCPNFVSFFKATMINNGYDVMQPLLVW
jgi:hypothetical protein